MSKSEWVTVLVGDINPGETRETAGERLAQVLHEAAAASGRPIGPKCTFLCVDDRDELREALEDANCPNVDLALMAWDQRERPAAALHYADLIDPLLN